MGKELITAASDIKPLAGEVSAMANTVEGLIIGNDDDLAQAGSMMKQLNTAHTILEDKRKAITDPLFKAKSEVDKLFKTPKDQIDVIRGELRAKMNSFAALQQMIADEEAAEQRAKDEAEAEELRKAAAELDEAGAPEAAETVVEQAAKIETQAAKPAKRAPARSMGATVSTRTTWGAEIVDPREFLRAVADGDYPMDCIDIKLQPLHRMATKDKVEKTVRGVRFKKSVGVGVL